LTDTLQTAPGLRQEQAEAVRARLVAAAIAVIESGEEPTMRSVARAAGVSERTIYRYFAARDDLHAAVGEAVKSRASAVHPEDVDALEKYARTLFGNFADNEALVRALVSAPWVAPMYKKSRPNHLRALEAILANAFPAVPRAERRNAAAALRVAISGAGWVHLRDCGFSNKQAVNQARWLVQAILAQLEARGNTHA
jgi:AcrR family transcriptional regulator